MNHQLLNQAQLLGRQLIARGALSSAQLTPRFHEYRALLEGGGGESFARYLARCGLLPPDQARAWEQWLSSSQPPSASAIAPVTPTAASPQLSSTVTAPGPSSSSALPNPAASRSSASRPPSRASRSGSRSAGQGGGLKELAGYKILDVLGRGAQGIVYKARDKAWNEVALKVMTSPKGNERLVKRFDRERRVLEELDHPGIVKLVAAGSSEHGEWIAMELIHGAPLKDVLEKQNPSVTRIAEMLAAAARAVHAAHEKGVIHRDLKPSNVFVAEDGSPKVVDFGLAKHVDGQSMLTQEGAVLGTPYYLAPEQISPEVGPIAASTDVYALGVILYEALTGERPFSAPTIQGLYRNIMTIKPEAPHIKKPAVPRSLSAIALMALEKRPASRYKSAAALAEDLERAGRGEDALAQKRRLLPSLRGRSPALIAGLALIPIALAVGGWFGTAAWLSRRRLGEATDRLRSQLTESARRLRPNTAGRVEPAAARAVVEAAADIRAFADERPADAKPLLALLQSPKLTRKMSDAFLAEARRSFKEDRLDEALNAIDQARPWTQASDPARRALDLLEGQALAGLKRFEDAGAAVERALQAKDDAEARALRGEVRLGLGQAREAAEDFASAAEQAAPDERPLFRARQARALNAVGEPEASKRGEALFAELLGQDQVLAAVLVLRARDLSSRGLFAEAEESLRQAEKKSPGQSVLRRERLELLALQERFDEAEVLLSEAITERPKDSRLRVERARVRIRLGRLEEAREDCARIVDPGAALAAEVALASILAIEGKKEAALTRVGDVLMRAPKMREALWLRACLSRGTDEAEGALAALAAVAPRELGTLALRADAALSKGDDEAAVAHIDAINKLAPEGPEAPLLRGRLFVLRRRAAQGRDGFDESARRRNELAAAGRGPCGAAARLLALRSRGALKDEGLARLRLAALERPWDPEPLWRLARRDTGMKPDKRCELARRALDLDPFCRPAWAQIALLTIVAKRGAVSAAADKALEAIELVGPRGFEPAAVLEAKARALIRDENPEGAREAIEKVEALRKKRSYRLRADLARSLKKTQEASAELEREREDRKRFVQALNKANAILGRGDGSNPKGGDVREKARALIEEAEAIDGQSLNTVRTRMRLQVNGEQEGFSGSIYYARYYLDSPKNFYSLVRFSDQILISLAKFGDVPKKVDDAAEEYGDFDERTLCFYKAMYHYTETLNGLGPEERARRARLMLTRAEEVLRRWPETLAAYIVRAHAYALQGQAARAEVDWRLIERAGEAPLAKAARAYAVVALGNGKRSVLAIEEALAQGASKSFFKDLYCLEALIKTSRLKKILGE